MEPEPFRRILVAGYSDTFSGRDVRPASMMAFLEETAAEHCRSIGRDLFSLMEDGGGWVLTGGGMQMERYPRYGETFSIETWLSDWKTFSGIREYRIRSADGSFLGEAGGRWVYWDLSTRRPTPVPEDFRLKWHFCPDSPYRRIYPDSATPNLPWEDGSGPDSGGAADAPSGGEPETRVRLDVRRGDVDLYGHLHNTTYMDWLLEAVPVHLWSGSVPMDMGLRFFAEARLGDAVVFETRRRGRYWLHDVVREEDSRLLVRGFSSWCERPAVISA